MYICKRGKLKESRMRFPESRLYRPDHYSIIRHYPKHHIKKGRRAMMTLRPFFMGHPLESELLEEVVALVVHEDECREVLYADLPDSFHTELRILDALDALDVVLGKDGCRASD